MENVLIECSQRETDRRVYPIPGEYMTTLAKPVFIYPGDELAVSKTFLDTQAKSDGIIVIEPINGVDVRLDWAVYSTNWANFNYEPLPGRKAPIQNDNVDYIFGKFKRVADGTMPADMIHITHMSIYRCSRVSAQGAFGDPTNNPKSGEGHGPKVINTKLFPVQISYEDVLGNPQILSIDVPYNASTDPGYGVKVDVLAQQNTINISKPYKNVKPGSTPFDGNWAKNMPGCGALGTLIKFSTSTDTDDQQGFTTPFPNDPDSGESKIACILVKAKDNPTQNLFSKDVFAPVTFSTTFNIPQGKYLPDDLCDFINNNLDTTGVNTTFSDGTQSENQLLFNSTHIASQYDPSVPGDDFAIMSEANSWTKQLPVNAPTGGGANVRSGQMMLMKPERWIGTNQVELLFDKGDNRFYWNYLHFPIYLKDVTSTGFVRNQEVGQAGNANFIVNARKNGGVFFTNLSASTKDITKKENAVVEEYDFWSDKLGFKVAGDSPENIVAQPPQHLIFTPFDTTNEVTATNYAIKDGQHTTNATSRLDQLIDKTNTATTNFQIVPSNTGAQAIKPPTLPLSGSYITTTINTPVKASVAAVSGELLDTGYYLLELNAGLTNLIMDSNKQYRNISGIINRYFSLGSYTSTGMDSSLVYTHVGEPIALSDINIRVLNPNKTPAEIGFDNTIFLELNRGAIAKALGTTEQQQDVGQAPE